MKRLFLFSLGLVFLFMSLCVEAAYPDVLDDYSNTELAIDAHIQGLSEHINEVYEYFNRSERYTNHWNGKAIEPAHYGTFEARQSWWAYYAPNGRWSIKLPEGWAYDDTITTPLSTSVTFSNSSSFLLCFVIDLGPLGPLDIPLAQFVIQMRDAYVRLGVITVVSDVAPITTNEGNTGYEFTIRLDGGDKREAYFTNNEGELFSITFLYETGNPYTGNNTEIIKSLELDMAAMPDIKVNGSNGPITLSQSDSLTVTVALDNNDITDNADWWLAVETPFGLYFYTFDGWTTDWVPVYQGPLFYLDSYQVLTVAVSELQPGTYTFYFGVDTNMDGNVTWNSLCYDSAVVTSFSFW